MSEKAVEKLPGTWKDRTVLQSAKQLEKALKLRKFFPQQFDTDYFLNFHGSLLAEKRSLPEFDWSSGFILDHTGTLLYSYDITGSQQLFGRPFGSFGHFDQSFVFPRR